VPATTGTIEEAAPGSDTTIGSFVHELSMNYPAFLTARYELTQLASARHECIVRCYVRATPSLSLAIRTVSPQYRISVHTELC